MLAFPIIATLAFISTKSKLTFLPLMANYIMKNDKKHKIYYRIFIALILNYI